MKDEQIFIGLRNQDKEAFNMLFDELYTPVQFFTEKITLDFQESEDIAIHTFAKFWECLVEGSIQFESYRQVQKYLFTVARNAAFNYLEKKKNQKAHNRGISYISPAVITTTVEDVLITTEQMVVFRNEVEKLPAQMREVFKLIYFENLSRSEIAKRLNISLSTVNNHFAIAMSKLRQVFSKKELLLILTLIGIGTN